MSQHRRYEVVVRCDVPGCFTSWHYASATEHQWGRPSGWLYVNLSPPGPFIPPDWSRDLDFCPCHAHGEEALRAIATRLAHARLANGKGTRA